MDSNKLNVFEKAIFLLVTSSNMFNQIKQKQSLRYLEASFGSTFPFDTDKWVYLRESSITI